MIFRPLSHTRQDRGNGLLVTKASFLFSSATCRAEQKRRGKESYDTLVSVIHPCGRQGNNGALGPAGFRQQFNHSSSSGLPPG